MEMLPKEAYETLILKVVAKKLLPVRSGRITCNTQE